MSSLSHGWPPTTATPASSLKASKVFENMRPFSVHEGQELILLVRRVQQLNTPMHVELVVGQKFLDDVRPGGGATRPWLLPLCAAWTSPCPPPSVPAASRVPLDAPRPSQGGL